MFVSYYQQHMSIAASMFFYHYQQHASIDLQCAEAIMILQQAIPLGQGF
jgi:hypothetical protein